MNKSKSIRRGKRLSDMVCDWEISTGLFLKNDYSELTIKGTCKSAIKKGAGIGDTLREISRSKCEAKK